MKQFRIGFLGCGFAAGLHAHAYKRVPGFEATLHAVCSADLHASEAFATEHGFAKVYESVEQLLDDPAIDIVDIIVPPKYHVALVKQAMEKGKHVICEKPFNGYFGKGSDSKITMFEKVCAELDDFSHFLQGRKEQLFYAENFIYAPAVAKVKEFLQNTGEKTLLLRGEESHSGSHAPHAALWEVNGGGSLIRQGCHPLSALLYLKQVEAKTRGEDIWVSSVLCDASVVTEQLPQEEKGSILSKPVDVEDWSETIITFSDNTKAVVTSGDMVVGGVRNTIEAYTSNSCYTANIAPNDALVCYHTDDSKLDDVYFTEKVETKKGWQNVFLSEEEMRGYVGELEDFFICLTSDKKPESGFPLADETMRVIYASYASAELGKRFNLEKK